MSDPAETSPTPRRRGVSALAWLLALLLLGLAGGYGWHRWQAESAAHAQAREAAAQQLQALESRVDGLRRDQRAQAARLQQAEATNRLLRDELLGLGQRAALVEESLQELADSERHASQALRLDEVELVLARGQERLLLAGDLEGARRAYALAAQLLEAVAAPEYLNLRQALAQERAALDALGEDPRVSAAGRIEALSAALPSLPRQVAKDADARPWWRRAFARLVDVRPSSAAGPSVAPADHEAGLAALRLELTLAQAAAERRDVAGFRAALARADGWLLRLWPDSPARTRQRAALEALRGQSLLLDLPALGSTLAQLRRQRSAP